MPQFPYKCPVQIRYGDLDPQWHVNNAHYATFIEYARFTWIRDIGLFDGVSFFDLGLIVADLHIVYKAPIKPTQKVQVGLRVARLGNKSFTLEYQIEDVDTGEVMATAETVMVHFNYHAHASEPLPQAWREKMSAYTGA